MKIEVVLDSKTMLEWSLYSLTFSPIISKKVSNVTNCSLMPLGWGPPLTLLQLHRIDWQSTPLLSMLTPKGVCKNQNEYLLFWRNCLSNFHCSINCFQDCRYRGLASSLGKQHCSLNKLFLLPRLGPKSFLFVWEAWLGPFWWRKGTSLVFLA